MKTDWEGEQLAKEFTVVREKLYLQYMESLNRLYQAKIRFLEKQHLKERISWFSGGSLVTSIFWLLVLILL